MTGFECKEAGVGSRKNGENTGWRRPDGTFGPGNPGRPKGSRNKLGTDFLNDLYAHWSAAREDGTTEGQHAIRQVSEKDPVAFVRLVASLVPKELLVRSDPLESVSDEGLEELIEFYSEFRRQHGQH